MRRLFTGFLVAALAALVPITAIASDRDMELAIKKSMETSGKLHYYEIDVRCQQGTAWLSGRVASNQQAGVALRLAAQTPGVERVVNRLTIESPTAAQTAYAAPLSPPSGVMQTAFSSGQSEPTIAPPTGLESLQGADESVPQKATPAPARSIKTSKASRPLPMARTQPTRTTTRRAPVKQVAAEAVVEAGPVPQPGPVAQGAPIPIVGRGPVAGPAPARYDQPNMPNYAWPSYAAYPNYAALTYPRQYSPTAWPYIGPFYPYPQVPLGWRKVTLEWDDGWWWLDFKNCPSR